MSFYHDAVGATGHGVIVGRCVLGEFVRGLPLEDQEGFRRALADLAVSAQAILTVLQRRGYAGTTPATILRHRAGQCRYCPRSAGEER